MAHREQATVLAAYIKGLPDFTVTWHDAGRGVYQHMGATISDGILQAGIKYSTVVLPRVTALLERYPGARTTPSPRHRRAASAT